MSLLNDIFRYFITQRLRDLDEFRQEPHLVQRQLFDKLISKGRHTEWGQKHGFARINKYEDWARQVPLQDYNSLKPFIERMIAGGRDVLWPGQVNWYAKSSGTTDDRSKFIPVSDDALQDCHYKAGKDMYAVFYQQYDQANLVDGKTLVIGGSHSVSQLNEHTKYGDLSAVLMQNAPFWAEMKRTPDLKIALMDEWENKVEQMAKATVDQNVTNILGVPTWTVVLIRRLFEMTGKDNLLDIWPNLQLYVHGGVSFKPYRELFSSLIKGSGMHYIDSYNASEGYFGFQDNTSKEDLLLLLNHGVFYEFIPAEQAHQESPDILPLEEVKTGQNYAMVITTNSGLWRYMIGDTVRFTSTSPYRIEVSGRTKHFINAFGEEVIVDNAERALARTCEELDCLVRDYTAAPVYFSGSGNGAHEWLVEFEREPQDLNTFCQKLDAYLREINSDYDAKRQKDIALRMPEIHKLPQGTFYNWMKRRGKLGGQNKVPRLSNSRQYVDDLLSFASEDGE